MDGWVEIDVWAPPDAAAAEGLRADLAALGIDSRVVATPEAVDWRQALRDYHRPVAIAGRLWVRPPWIEPRTELADVRIDPGLGFGTGQHQTTRRCLTLLCDRPPGSLLDAGCGSGVLAIAARRLGHDPVWAIDGDPAAVADTRRNARANRVGLTIGQRLIGRDRLPGADGVAANLTSSVMPALAGALADNPPRWAILSGLRAFEVAGAIAAFARIGLREIDVHDDEGWCTALVGA